MQVRHYSRPTTTGIVQGMDTTTNLISPPTPRPGSPRPLSDAATLGIPPSSDTALAVRDLRCWYGDYEAVRGIDLTVHRGETFALLGTNGAGKTTTLETLEGHRRADEGHVEVLGLDPSRDRRTLAARIGIVFQSSGLPADLTPTELLTTWRSLTPGAAHHLDVGEVLTRVELEHRASVQIRVLSGGERRRLDLAVALLTSPELIFLDEPTTGMDPQARERTWQILRDLRAEGVTIVLTTHYLEEAEALADRLAIMHEGGLAATGTLAEVVATRPATIRVDLPAGAATPPELQGDVEVEDGRLMVATRHLQDDLTCLLRWARTHELRLSGLHASEASLSQVFHDIAGASLPDPHHAEEAHR